MIKCSECGYENMDGLDYCDGCGAKLERAPAPTEPATTPSPGVSAAPAPAGASHVTPAAAPTPTPDTVVPSAEPVITQPPAAEHVVAPETNGGATVTQAEEPSVHPLNQAAAMPGPEQVESAEPSSRAPTGEMNAAAAPMPSTSVVDHAAVPVKAKLAVIRGGRRGQEFELEPGNNLVGRWDPETGSFPEVDLDADDPEAKISRKHALIRLEGGKITIEDIGSLNGTYVNRQPRLQPGNPLDLKDGDEIIIGKTFLKLSISPIS
jgi:predicted component of type VI protein secretion system